MNLVLVGAPLSGKGSQAELISKNFDLVHISMGDVFRSIRSQNTPLGRLVDSYLSKAMLVPDDVTIKVLTEKLSSIPKTKGVLLDGFPRTLHQAKQLESILQIDAVIYLNISLENILKRIENRYICTKCNKTNTAKDKFIPCTFCGGKLTKRLDDTEDIVRERFKEFKLFTQSVIDFYNKNHKLMQINGNNSLQNVYEDIKLRLEAL